MKTLRERLRQFEADAGHPIRVGLVGAGQMGTGLVGQMELMDGMRAMAVADVVPGRAYEALMEADVPEDKAAATASAEEADAAIESGRAAALESMDTLLAVENIDIVVESTGIPEVGAQVCMKSIEAGKNVINMNVEADATIG